ncbi:MAG TPA: lysylphosphatidylglycerol synthase transmembrane domain-containing protein [Tepidisphaeraceae bacterium]|nr:lysylphosphatidylglycerol synthase transmembrane domain-containing protein [Tepidisphaeraceae bacterium]
MTDRTKKWLKFTVRWGIAAFGVWWVLSNINFTDRVMVLDPATNRPRYVAAINAQEDAAEFIIAPKGEEPRRIRRDELWVRPDRAAVSIRLSPGEPPQKRKLLAIKPGGATSKGRSIRELLVEDPATHRGVVVLPDQLVGARGLDVASPYVEIGLTRMVREADRSFLIAAICILPIGYVLTSIRWFFLLRGLGVQIGLGRTLVINMVGAFYNSFMPGTTGGDVIKAYYAAKHTPLRTRAVMTVLVDRVIGLLALIIVGGSMAAYQWEIEDCRRVAIGSAVILVGVGLGAIIFYNRTLRRLSGLSFILSRLPMQKQVHKAVEAMEVYGHRPLPVVAATLVSFPVHAMSILSASFAGMAFRLPLGLFYYWVVVPVVALVGAIPISPQGAGVMEFFAVQLTKRQGATISQAFILTMSIRLLAMFWNLVAGLFVLRGGYHSPTVKEQEEMESDDSSAAASDATAAKTSEAMTSSPPPPALRGGAGEGAA